MGASKKATNKQKLIKKHLSSQFWTQAMLYDIPEEFLKTDAKLIELILLSKAIDSQQEKQNWFNLLPIMTDQQIEKLRNILTKEQQKLKEIEEKYMQKKNEIKKKYLLKWQQLGYIRQTSKVKQEEEQQKVKDETEAEKLLENL